jgi:hypothetical protein
MTWLYKTEPFSNELIDKYVGFVYIIRNKDNGKYYIGKKSFTKVKRYQKNKKKKRMLIESEWESYTGSNLDLNEDIANGARIEKEILHLCKSKAEMSYYEAKLQFEYDVLRDEKAYNQWIMVRVRKTNIIGLKND